MLVTATKNLAADSGDRSPVRHAGAWAHRISATWIIGLRADLVFLSGGVVVGYAIVFAYTVWRFDVTLLWFAWLAVLGGPHLFATYTRTYFSRAERQSRAGLLWSSLGLFLVSPVIAVLIGASSVAGFAWHRASLLGFIAASLWAYWHLIRQHYGLVRLYGRKHDDRDKIDYRIDWLLVHVGLLAPFVALLAGHPELRANLQLPPDAPGAAGFESVNWLKDLCLSALGLVVAAFLVRQIYRATKGRRVNGPKLILLLLVVPYYFFICTSSEVQAAPLFAVAPLLAIPHDLQYHAMVWLYNRNQKPAVPEGGQSGAIIAVSLYAAGALVFGVVLATLSCSVDRALACAPLFYDATPTVLAGLSVRDILYTTFYGFFLHHYVIDQRIWKPDRDPRVAKGLGVG